MFGDFRSWFQFILEFWWWFILNRNLQDQFIATICSFSEQLEIDKSKRSYNICWVSFLTLLLDFNFIIALKFSRTSFHHSRWQYFMAVWSSTKSQSNANLIRCFSLAKGEHQTSSSRSSLGISHITLLFLQSCPTMAKVDHKPTNGSNDFIEFGSMQHHNLCPVEDTVVENFLSGWYMEILLKGRLPTPPA